MIKIYGNLRFSGYHFLLRFVTSLCKIFDLFSFVFSFATCVFLFISSFCSLLFSCCVFLPSFPSLDRPAFFPSLSARYSLTHVLQLCLTLSRHPFHLLDFNLSPFMQTYIHRSSLDLHFSPSSLELLSILCCRRPAYKQTIQLSFFILFLCFNLWLGFKFHGITLI